MRKERAMPTYIKTRTNAAEQERQQILSAAAALRTAAPYLNQEQRQRVYAAAQRCIDQHRRTTHTAELAALVAQRDALTA